VPRALCLSILKEVRVKMFRPIKKELQGKTGGGLTGVANATRGFGR
jgi:hypothetical protein